MNALIDRMPPLDKDIVVFRHVDSNDFLPRKIGAIISHSGYLSTTMDAGDTVEAVCESFFKEKTTLMKIYVPKGMKALCIPGYERELIFNHKTRLKLLGVKQQKFVCPDKTNVCYVKDNVTVFRLAIIK